MQDYFAPLRDKPEYLTPVSYFLTEAHDSFNADEWQQRGRAVQYYASKHRHLHDELVLETQFPGQLDNKMRELVQETHELINNYQRSIGPFARKGGFERRVFYKVPKGKAEPFQTVTFTLDIEGVASCYHTTGALGIIERAPSRKDSGAVVVSRGGRCGLVRVRSQFLSALSFSRCRACWEKCWARWLPLPRKECGPTLRNQLAQ